MHRYFKYALFLTLAFSIPLYSQDWGALHNLLIKFYTYQRSGLKSGNPYNPFYTHAASDGKYPHSNDVADGGWYDAGDFVKFGLPAGYVTYCLLMGYNAFPSSYDDLDSWDLKGSKDGIPDILNEAKVGTDYLIKAVVSSSSVILDIGNGNNDHQTLGEDGYANSNRLNNRKVEKPADGADAPGYYAAALALMSILYKKHDATYAATCLQKAKDAYTFGKNNPKTSSVQNCNTTGQPFYSTTTWMDKMACAAVELFRATNDSTYLKSAISYLGQVKPHYDAVSTQYGGDFAAYELLRWCGVNITSAWMGDVNNAIGKVLKSGQYVTGAYVNTMTWGVCKTAANAAFSAALLYMVTGDRDYKDFALQQIKWVAGISPYSKSWITKYGSGCPQRPHHRNNINLGGKLAGGIISGPTSSDGGKSWSYSDNQDNFTNNEVAIDYNAGAVGAVAFLRYYFAPSDTVRIENPPTAKPDPINFNTVASVAITASLSKSIAWKLILQGESSKATKTFTGNGASISVSWTGDADASGGQFMSQEKIFMKLDIPTLWEVQKANPRSFFLQSLKTIQFTAADKELDNFNDAAVTDNVIGGKWSAFSDASDKVAGGASLTPTVSADIGYENTKGITFRLNRSAGATVPCGPYCGIKTTFTPNGGAANIGAVTKVVFDVSPGSDNASLWIEFEQPDIADKAYYGAKISFGKGGSWTRIWIPIANFTQPSWKTAATPLNLQRISALRLTGYGVANDKFIIDNLRITDMSVGIAPQGGPRHPPVRGVSVTKATSSALVYRFSFPGGPVCGPITATVFDGAGRSLRSWEAGNGAAEAPLVERGFILAPGVYFLRIAATSAGRSCIGKFVVGRN